MLYEVITYGNAQAQAGTTYIPLKVNFANVMPRNNFV